MPRILKPLILLLLTLSLLCNCAVAEQSPPSSSAGVTYEIFVASFADHNGDGCGDLLGIVDKLDYLTALGVDRLWLMPIHPSPSYHKYDVTDYCAVDSSYGTLEDFDTLVKACREKGIDVMLDLVINHSSSQHPWFLSATKALQSGTDSPYLDWYHFTQGSGNCPVEGTTDWYYEASFGYHMPDLNLDNEEVRAELARIVTFWQSHGVKGFRLDAVTSYYAASTVRTVSFLSWLNETVKANDPECYLVGEAWSDESTILSLYSSGIDSLFNFPLADNTGALIHAAQKGTGASLALRAAEWNMCLKAVSPASIDAPFLTNHDMGRVAGMLRGKLMQEKIAAALYLLLPGRPTLYYGEELGMTGSGKDENKRLPMVWSTAEDAVLCLPPPGIDQRQRVKTGVLQQASDPGSLLSFYRQVLTLRAQCPELTYGSMTAVDTGVDSVACWIVAQEDSRVFICLNTSSEAEAMVSMPDGLQMLGTLDAGAGAAQSDGDRLRLPPGSGVVGKLAP